MMHSLRLVHVVALATVVEQATAEDVSNAPPTEDEILSALGFFGGEIEQLLAKDTVNNRVGSRDGGCELRAFGSGYGTHTLCNRHYRRSSMALSYGISHDFSFDVDVANHSGLTVMCFDPTVTHPAKLVGDQLPVFFQAWGAPGPFFSPKWIKAPPARLAVGMGWDVKVLKMDCEGCEQHVSRDVLAHNPGFFSRLDQFALETHLSRTWMGSFNNLKEYGSLLAMLKRNGFELQHVAVGTCGPHENAKLVPEIRTSGYYRRHKYQCENLLFARREQLADAHARSNKVHKDHKKAAEAHRPKVDAGKPTSKPKLLRQQHPPPPEPSTLRKWMDRLTG